MLIIEETIEGTAGYTIRYLYDDNNLLLGFIYNNTTYYYQRTLTGDIARIVDEVGEIKGEYIYDAFGKILNIDIHPFPIAKNSTEYRTIDDMVYEWQEHNKGFLYSTRLPDGKLKNRGIGATMDVDINLGDQGKNVYQLMWERIF